MAHKNSVQLTNIYSFVLRQMPDTDKFSHIIKVTGTPNETHEKLDIFLYFIVIFFNIITMIVPHYGTVIASKQYKE